VRQQRADHAGGIGVCADILARYAPLGQQARRFFQYVLRDIARITQKYPHIS
jgi:hypothetical protein